ncbi:MAG: acetyl-CoA carboxylase biotin carboxyl carrier protein [Acidobacteriaceae bacterium]|nr:acetyl-CoA carboxylase biotin carboxyl carrier protein [Acidobacteriaceae bacterium]
MTIDEIKELIRVVNETGIAELEVQRGDNRVRIRRASPSPQDVVMPAVLPLAVNPSVSTVATPPALPPVQPEVPAIMPPAATTAKEGENDIVVKSPIVGTYYDSPAPGMPSFVKIGDRVEPKQVLCIIESMKLMNEIEAEIAGTITAKFIENGRPVEYAESLFTIRPVGS